MKAMKWMTALAALGTLGIVSSQAAALACYSPALGLFSDIVQAGGSTRLNVACSSRPSGGSLTRVSGNGYIDTTRIISANLTAGPGYARVGAYGTNRVGLGCFAVDANPTTSSTVFVTCSTNVGFIDMEIGN